LGKCHGVSEAGGNCALVLGITYCYITFVVVWRPRTRDEHGRPTGDPSPVDIWSHLDRHNVLLHVAYSRKPSTDQHQL